MPVHKNAVLDNMLTTRFRNFRPVLLITLYNLLMVGTIVLIMGFSTVLSYSAGMNANVAGSMLFATIVLLQFGLIVFIMPAITAGLISGERERKTLDLLLCTQMTPLGIIAGKLMSACLFMGLCVVCSVPMITMAYLYGGVSALSILSIVACYLVTILAIGSLGIFFSAVFKRTTTAVVVCYLTVFLLGTVSTVGGYLEMAFEAMMNQNVSSYVPGYPAFWIINPLMALLELVGTDGGQSFLGTLMSLTGSGVWPAMWPWELLTLVVISAGLILASARALAPVRGWKAWRSAGGAGKVK